MADTMPHSINEARRNLRARLGKRVAPRPDAGPPLTAEEADLTARLQARLAAIPSPQTAPPFVPATVTAVSPPPPPLPEAETTEPTITSLKWRDASRRARWHNLPRILMAWIVTAIVILAVFGTAMVTLIGWDRSVAVALSAAALIH